MTAPSADSWKLHEAAQRRAWLALTYEQRFRWLVQAKRFCAKAMEAARSRNRSLRS